LFVPKDEKLGKSTLTFFINIKSIIHIKKKSSATPFYICAKPTCAKHF
jgi:hypothetical protein